MACLEAALSRLFFCGPGVASRSRHSLLAKSNNFGTAIAVCYNNMALCRVIWGPFWYVQCAGSGALQSCRCLFIRRHILSFRIGAGKYFHDEFHSLLYATAYDSFVMTDQISEGSLVRVSYIDDTGTDTEGIGQAILIQKRRVKVKWAYDNKDCKKYGIKTKAPLKPEEYIFSGQENTNCHSDWLDISTVDPIAPPYHLSCKGVSIIGFAKNGVCVLFTDLHPNSSIEPEPQRHRIEQISMPGIRAVCSKCHQNKMCMVLIWHIQQNEAFPCCSPCVRQTVFNSI